MDPAQLVQMALNLSESRKRHVSSTLPIPISPARGRRVVSGLDSGYGTVASGSSAGKRASYLDHHASSATDPLTQSQHDGARHDSTLDPSQNVFYTFSPATLSRAEKARRYFELASEHRRLLQHLPPLKPDARAPGNFTLRTTSSPGSAHYGMTRVVSANSTKQRLGRPHNPLQALRNRRTRNRERRPLTASADAFQEIEKIRRWIDDVEAKSQDDSYRPGEDRIELPVFSGDLEGDSDVRPETSRGHRRTDTVGSVITRPENNWTIEPAELLADTYWIEKGDNKTVIEDKHGNRIFQTRPRASLEVPRRSREIGRSHEPDVNNDSQADDSEGDEHNKLRRRNVLPLTARLRRNPITRSNSVSTVSSDEGRKPPPHRFGHDEGGDENIGPLERHMREMIAKDEKGELSSPELVSPDHWDSKNTPFPNSRHSMDRPRQESFVTANGRLSVDTQRPRRSRSVEGKPSSIDHGMSSSGLLPNGPVSPVMPGFVPLDSLDYSKQTSTVQSKNKGLRLPTFRSRSKERNKIEQTDFAHSSHVVPLSPVISIGADKDEDQPRSSIDSATHPPKFRRQRTADSHPSSIWRSSTVSTADAGGRDAKASTGRGFLKGTRIGELVRNESSRLGERLRGSREGVDPDLPGPRSETSDFENGRVLRRQQTDEDDQVSPRGSLDRERPKPKYFMSNLPSFRSPMERDQRDRKGLQSPMSESDNPFESLSTRFRPSRNGVPRSDLPDQRDAPESELPVERALGSGADLYDRRQSVSQSNLTWAAGTSEALPKLRGRDTPAKGKRHWSISDQNARQQESLEPQKTTARDIARVRALLLASGIKAHEIYSKADTVRDPPPSHITKAAQTAGRRLDSVPRKEEDIVAARMLSEMLDGTITTFEQTLQQFQEHTAKNLAHELDEMSHKAADQLTKLVHETSDEADAFNVELTEKCPQDVKRLDEAVDQMFRQRRRQFRLLRRTGFKLLEWLVLGIMWWVWFIVVVFNTLKKALIFFVRIFRWLLWF